MSVLSFGFLITFGLAMSFGLGVFLERRGAFRGGRFEIRSFGTLREDILYVVLYQPLILTDVDSLFETVSLLRTVDRKGGARYILAVVSPSRVPVLRRKGKLPSTFRVRHSLKGSIVLSSVPSSSDVELRA